VQLNFFLFFIFLKSGEKMKKIMIFLVLLFIPLVWGYVAGDNLTFTIENCIPPSMFEVKVVGENAIADNEYWLENCTQLYDNVWGCNCNAEITTLILHSNPKTINSYNITANYELATVPTIQYYSSGGGGGRRYVYVNATNCSTCKNCSICPEPVINTIIINETIPMPVLEIPINNSTNGTILNETSPPIEQDELNFWNVIIGLAIIVFFIIGYVIYISIKNKGGTE
jgi:hypothetical protein